MTNAIQEFFATPLKRAADGREFRIDRTSLQLNEALALRQLVVESGATRTLEIGLALGASAIAIADALGQKDGALRHTALDPYQRAFGHVGTNEVERLGFKERVEILPVCSEDFLHDACKAGRRFDFIFHDGGHTIGQKVTDAFFADRCLGLGGIIAFHDAFLQSTVACVKYLVQERAYELLALPADSPAKRLARVVRYGIIHGRWYGSQVVPHTCRSLVALRKTAQSVASQ